MPTRRCGKAADIPVNQLSNSIGERVALSRNLGSNNWLELREAKPDSQVVADTTPASRNQGRNF
jgi:hypothetical protein